MHVLVSLLLSHALLLSVYSLYYIYTYVFRQVPADFPLKHPAPLVESDRSVRSDALDRSVRSVPGDTGQMLWGEFVPELRDISEETGCNLPPDGRTAVLGGSFHQAR